MDVVFNADAHAVEWTLPKRRQLGLRDESAMGRGVDAHGALMNQFNRLLRNSRFVIDGCGRLWFRATRQPESDQHREQHSQGVTDPRQAVQRRYVLIHEYLQCRAMRGVAS